MTTTATATHRCLAADEEEWILSAIYRREVRSYFCGMTGAIFMAFILCMTGIYMTVYNLMGGYPNFEVALSGMAFVFLIAVPVLTMRSFSEEKHARTDQLLYALPLSMTAVVMAKFLAMVTVLAIPVGVMCLYPLLLATFGTVSLGSAYGAILAFFLLGCALVSIGMFLSSLTESQVIAAVLGVAAMLFCYLMNGIAGLIPTTAAASFVAFLLLACAVGLIVQAVTKDTTAALTVTAVLVFGIAGLYFWKSELFAGTFPKLLQSLALFDRLSDFTNGIFDLTAIVYYLSVCGLFCFLTVQSMEKKRFA